MERELILPKAPFISEHNFVRENVAYKAVKGINNRGRGFCYLESVELVDELLKSRMIPTRVYQEFDEQGVLSSIHTYWKIKLVHPVTGKVYQESSEYVHITNEADIIFFCAHLGIPILGSMLNGVVRGEMMGYDTQPIVDGAGNWIPDTNYDTIIPADKTAYDNRQPAYKEITNEAQI